MELASGNVDRHGDGKDFVYHARVVENNFDWEKSCFLNHPFEDLVIYEMHVRGFTRDASSGVKAPGTFEGLREKIPYLKDLGINAVELMPVFEFDEMEDTRVVDGERLYNYWGYNTVCFFAPNTSYTSVVEHNHEGDELKNLIYELKENGIEVILDVVFNHTAEGNEKGPCFSFKGIDNNIYYMLTPDGYYYNISGCGNVMNCNHPIVRKFIIDCLRYWVINYRVDGFRFDLASILSRDQNGAPMENPPILQGLACDPILAKAKLIAEAWDAGGLYQVGSFPSWNRWAEWNGRYRDDMRRFLKGDGGMAGTAITRITGSRDLYDPAHRGISASVNFLTCHDGFTLYDLYSYNMKHNEKNGWGNTDGDNNGNSWNCGAEGATDDPEIEGLRRRMVKNAFATLMCSRGPAMFFAGDEFCNTQFGNNNSYCQDNITSWLDWNRLEEYKEIHDFFRYMIRLRKDNAILRKTTKPAACKLPEISIHNGFPWNGGTDNNSRLIGIMYAGRDDPDEVQKSVSDWDAFNATAEKMKAAGYKMTSTANDTYRVYSNNVSKKWVSDDKKIQIDDNIMKWVDDSKKLVDAGETGTADLWSDDWKKGFYPEGKVFSYFGPAWLVNFSMAADESGSIGNQGGWGAAQGPQGFFWGGTWICAAAGTDNADLVKDIMLKMTTDDDIMKDIVVKDDDFVNNSTVMDGLADGTIMGKDDKPYTSTILGGQNPLPMYIAGVKTLDLSNLSAYDQGCNEEFQKAMKDYFEGNCDKDTAIETFKKAVIEKYPDISE